MNPLFIPALALLGALITDQAIPGSESTLGRFPEYRDKTQAWLKTEYDRLEDERVGAGYGPKPTNWVPRSVSNPEIIERQTAIKALLGQQLWQRPYSVAKNMGIPERKHRELVAKAIARGDLVPESVFEVQAHNQAGPGKSPNKAPKTRLDHMTTRSLMDYLSPAELRIYADWNRAAHKVLEETGPECGKRVLGRQDYCWTGPSVRNWIWERPFTVKIDGQPETWHWRLFASSRGLTVQVEDKHNDRFGKSIHIAASRALGEFLKTWAAHER